MCCSLVSLCSSSEAAQGGVIKRMSFEIFTRKYLRGSLFNKVGGLGPAAL